MIINHNMTDRVLVLLRHLTKERKGWKRFFSRWAISDEPLRHDAANLINMIRTYDPELVEERVLTTSELRMIQGALRLARQDIAEHLQVAEHNADHPSDRPTLITQHGIETSKLVRDRLDRTSVMIADLLKNKNCRHM